MEIQSFKHYPDYSSIRRKCLESLSRLDLSCIDLSADQHTSVGEDCYPLERFLFHLVKKLADSLIEHGKRFSSGGRHVQIVGIPFLEARICVALKILHFPLAEIDFHDAVVPFGVGIAAIGGKACAPAQRTGINMVKRLILFQAGSRGGRFLFKSPFKRNIRLPVTYAWRHIDRSMSDKYKFHGVYRIEMSL